MSNKGKYKPTNLPELESNRINASGLSGRDNVIIENAVQQQVAVSEDWLIARRVNGHFMNTNNSETGLKFLGFTGIKEDRDPLFYRVTPPKGWTRQTSGYWTTVYDEKGVERMTMFYKGAWYDQDAFVNFR
jgi:hypothetical protein